MCAHFPKRYFLFAHFVHSAEAPPYAARVLLFPDRATFAFLADFVATNLVSWALRRQRRCPSFQLRS